MDFGLGAKPSAMDRPVNCEGFWKEQMSEKRRLTRKLDSAVALRNAGHLDEAEIALADIVNDPCVGDLGQHTALGLPRRLQSARVELPETAGESTAHAPGLRMPKWSR